MNKHEGKKIGISFDAMLVGDITGYAPLPPSWNMISPVGTVTHSSVYSTSSSYKSTNAFDGSTSSYWRPSVTVPNWIKIEFEKSTWVNGFRWCVNSYRPNGFVLEGSNDDENWIELVNSTSPNSTGWHEFSFGAGSYTFLRWTITSGYSTRIYLYEIELSIGIGNEGAFTVIGEEYKYVDGPSNNGEVIPMNYPVERVEKHPTIQDAILLTIKTPYEFNNVLNRLTVDYDITKGNLMGRGGLIESFNKTFTPTDLIPVPDVGIIDKLSATTGVNTIDFKPVVYTSISDDKEWISASPGEVVIEFKDSGIIDP